jgi:hypothetical protein
MLPKNSLRSKAKSLQQNNIVRATPRYKNHTVTPSYSGEKHLLEVRQQRYFRRYGRGEPIPTQPE